MRPSGSALSELGRDRPAPGRTAAPAWLWLAIGVWAVAVVGAMAVAPKAALGLLALPLLAIPIVRSQADPTSVLSVYALFLFLVPAHLVVPGVGASGRPPVVIGILGLAWLGAAVVVPSIPNARGRQPLRVAMYLFAASFLMSYVAAYTRILPPVEERALARGLIVVAGSIGAALLAADGITTKDRLETLLRRATVFAAVVALMGMVQFFTGFDVAALIRVPGLVPNTEVSFFGEERFYQRVAGTAMHPIEFGVVMAMMLPIALHFAVVDRHLPPVRRLLPAALIAAVIPMSVSRSGTLAAAVGLLMLIPSWPKPLRGRAVLLGAGFLVLMRAAVPGLLGTIKALFVNLFNDPSTTGRTDDYELVGPIIAETPWFGRGFYTFLPDRYFTLDNQYLLSLVDSGLLGLVAVLGLFVVGISLARGARRRSEDFATRDLGQALAASLMATAITYATFDAFSFPMVTGLTFLLLGCAGALWRLTGGPAGPLRDGDRLVDLDGLYALVGAWRARSASRRRRSAADQLPDPDAGARPPPVSGGYSSRSSG